MYDELVATLRRQCVEMSCGNCNTCVNRQAADAIEELSRENKELSFRAAQLESMNDALIGETGAADALMVASKPRWIPAAERLPEKMQYVLVRYQNNDMAVASWFGGDEHIRFWRAMTDEGWCADCDTEPTHWMPLPEPPKEE